MADERSTSVKADTINGGIAIGANAQATGAGGSLVNQAGSQTIPVAPPPTPARKGLLAVLRSGLEGVLTSLIASLFMALRLFLKSVGFPTG